MKREMQWDDKFTSLTVGTDVVVTVRISNQKLVCDWSPEWAQWDDLQSSVELKQLIQRANDKLQHNSVSKGSGKSKQRRFTNVAHCRFISVYMPHAGYPHGELSMVYDQLDWILADAQNMNYASVLGGDFNTQWNVGVRGDMIREFSYMFGLSLANPAHMPESWTFRSSAGIKRQIDFILF
ncbi:unnamed protein product, partial [Symbiodinium sp. CCMP2456]